MEENIFNIYFSISIFAILGVLIRIGLNEVESELFLYFPLILTNSVGCIILGFVNAFKSKLSDWQYGVYIGLTTGLCGSITTFSSWSFAIFKDLFNVPAVGSYSYKNIVCGLIELIVGLAAYTALVKFGNHLGKFLPFSNPSEFVTSVTIRKEKPKMNIKFIIYACVAAVLFITSLVLAITLDDTRKVWLSCLMAPLGALPRYILSTKNSKFPNFPIGTFAANIAGTLCLAIFTIFKYSSDYHEFLCHFLMAVGDGFCGCLTTISTFVNELNSLNTKHLYIYCIASIVSAQFVIMVTFGIYGWTSKPTYGMSC